MPRRVLYFPARGDVSLRGLLDAFDRIYAPHMMLSGTRRPIPRKQIEEKLDASVARRRGETVRVTLSSYHASGSRRIASFAAHFLGDFLKGMPPRRADANDTYEPLQFAFANVIVG